MREGSTYFFLFPEFRYEHSMSSITDFSYWYLRDFFPSSFKNGSCFPYSGKLMSWGIGFVCLCLLRWQKLNFEEEEKEEAEQNFKPILLLYSWEEEGRKEEEKSWLLYLKLHLVRH